jgi:phosphate acetyltransferase
MARSLLVAPVADHSALARTCLGLLRALDRQGVKVAFVKPVAQPSADGGPDRSAELVAAVTALRPPEPLSTALLEQQLGQGELEVVLEKIVAAWEPVYSGSDMVVIQGLSPAPSRLYASSLNEALARALDATSCWPATGPRMATRRYWPSSSPSRPAATWPAEPTPRWSWCCSRW